jgi:hypothetical protein
LGLGHFNPFQFGAGRAIRALASRFLCANLGHFRFVGYLGPSVHEAARHV